MGSTNEPKTLMLLPVDCRVRVLSLIDCPKATMRLCQTCRTFGARLQATVELWHSVLAQKWGAPGARTSTELWYNDPAHKQSPARSFALTLPMLKTVRAFMDASVEERVSREPRAMPPRPLEHCVHEECVPVLLQEYRLVLEIHYQGRCILAQCVQCFEGMCNADQMGNPGAPMAFDARARAEVFKAPRARFPRSSSLGGPGAFVARLSVVALDGQWKSVSCLGESCGYEVEAMDAVAVDAMEVEAVQRLPQHPPRLRQVFFDDFCLPVSTFPLAVCQEIRDGLHDLENNDEPENGNWDNELGEGRGLAVGMDVHLSAQIEPLSDAVDAWRVSSFCVEPMPITAYPGNCRFDYYNDESCQMRGTTNTDEMATCFVWEASNLGKHVGDAHQRWGGA